MVSKPWKMRVIYAAWHARLVKCEFENDDDAAARCKAKAYNRFIIYSDPRTLLPLRSWKENYLPSQ